MQQAVVLPRCLRWLCLSRGIPRNSRLATPVVSSCVLLPCHIVSCLASASSAALSEHLQLRIAHTVSLSTLGHTHHTHVGMFWHLSVEVHSIIVLKPKE